MYVLKAEKSFKTIEKALKPFPEVFWPSTGISSIPAPSRRPPGAGSAEGRSPTGGSRALAAGDHITVGSS